MAEYYAKERNYNLLVFKADWETFGNAAGYMRNVGIVNASDEVFAFWDFKSPGTKHTIDITKKAGKPCYVYPLTQRPQWKYSFGITSRTAQRTITQVGGVVVFADTEARARELANAVPGCKIADDEKPVESRVVIDGEEAVYTMPDAGCC